MRARFDPTHRAMTLLIAAALALTAAASRLLAQQPGPGSVTVFAAASLKTAIDEAAVAYEKASGVKPVVSYAASSALAKQIEQGAPADMFVSADLEWMDYLAGKGLIDPATRRKLLGNTLVLIAPASSTVSLAIGKDFPLSAALGEGRLAIGEVKAVPAGRYAKAALETLGVWTSVEGRLAQAENVRAALQLVALGEAPLGIVYKTDALSEPKVKIVGEFPENSHPPIVYPLAVTAAAPAKEAAKAFVQWLGSSEATAIFVKRGFAIPR